MEIKVGEWVRTKKGYIGKVIKIRERIETYKNDREAYLVDWAGKRATYISQIKDIKHSSDKIDLIQKGDIILYDSNYLGRQIKLEVDYVRKKEEDYKWGEGWCSTCIDENIFINDIKAIVTNEQFSSIEYLFEEE